jgi:putative transposase
MYFVTICTYGKRCALGEIITERMHLSPLGQIVSECWTRIPDHFLNAKLDEYIFMPNHVHGIIVIRDGRGTACRAPTVEGFGKPVKNSLPTIIRSFKSAVTRTVNEMNDTPGIPFWQRNYYERVIRNDRELNLIRQYIEANPLQWELDRENPEYKGKHCNDEIVALLKPDDSRDTACRAPTRKNTNE